MTTDINDRTLTLTRIIDASPDKVFRCWSEPELIKQWFAPKPWTTAKVESDFRPGGATSVTMADENGAEYPNPGQYLEIIPNKKLVFTDGYVGDWVPSENPFFTAVLTFEEEGGKTRYTAKAIHWTKENKEAHEKMGFHEGWGITTSQLEQLAKTL
jgi:uncharacterized protein YndB with AHSA1/START domain